VPNHGRLLHAKHLFPFLFAPWFQLRRLLLRLDWALFAPLRIASLWTASAVCGVVGVIGAIALFLFNTPPTPVSASTVEPNVIERIAITIPTELGPGIPLYNGPIVPQPIAPPVVPTKTTWSNLQVQFTRTHLPRGWDLRERQVLTSRPERPLYAQNLYAMRDGWFTMDLSRHGQMFRDTIQPYISRQGVTALQLAPSFAAADTLDPTQPVAKDRHPAIVVSREQETPASLHQETTYALVVANPSPELIESAIVEERISALHRVVNTDPPASLTTDGNALQWNVANLRPGENRRLRVTLSPESSDPVQHQTIVTVTSRVAASTSIRPPFVPPENPVPVSRPAAPPVAAPVTRALLELDLEQPQQVEIGGDVRAFFVVRNIGNAPARDVVTYVTISNQLDHRYGEYLEHRIAELAPGDTRRIKFYAVGARPGVASLTSRLSASNAQAVSHVFQIAINGTAGNSGKSLAQPGGPGVTDPRTFPGQNPGPSPGGNAPRSTVPNLSRIDRDDGLPTRVPSTVPNGGFQPVQPTQSQPSQGGPLSGGPLPQNSGNPFQPDSGNWRGAAPGEQPGPMTSPFGNSFPQNGAGAPGYTATPDPRSGKSTVPSTSRPDLDDSLPLRVQSTVPEGSFPQGNNPGGTMLRSGEQPGYDPNGPYPQENTPLNAFPPGVAPSGSNAVNGNSPQQFPQGPFQPRSQPGGAPQTGNFDPGSMTGNGNGVPTQPNNAEWRSSGRRERGPGRDPRLGGPQEQANPSFVPQGNDPGGYSAGAPTDPRFQPQTGVPTPGPGGTEPFPGFGNPALQPNGPLPTELGDPQSLPSRSAPDRTRGPGRTVPTEERGQPSYDGPQNPAGDLFSPNPGSNPAMERERPFEPAGPAGGPVPFTPTPASPGGPAGPSDSSIPRPNGSSFLIEDPVNSTIPGGRQYGPMPMVEPHQYPSIVPGYAPSYGQPFGQPTNQPFGQPTGQPFAQPTNPSFGQPAGQPGAAPQNPFESPAGQQPFVPAQPFPPNRNEPTPAGDPNAKPI